MGEDSLFAERSDQISGDAVLVIATFIVTRRHDEHNFFQRLTAFVGVYNLLADRAVVGIIIKNEVKFIACSVWQRLGQLVDPGRFGWAGAWFNFFKRSKRLIRYLRRNLFGRGFIASAEAECDKEQEDDVLLFHSNTILPQLVKVGNGKREAGSGEKQG